MTHAGDIAAGRREDLEDEPEETLEERVDGLEIRLEALENRYAALEQDTRVMIYVLADLIAEKYPDGLTARRGDRPRPEEPAAAPDEDQDEDQDEGDDLKPYCATSGATVGIFRGHGDGWHHYRGNGTPENPVELYDAVGHEPAVAWH